MRSAHQGVVGVDDQKKKTGAYHLQECVVAQVLYRQVPAHRRSYWRLASPVKPEGFQITLVLF